MLVVPKANTSERSNSQCDRGVPKVFSKTSCSINVQGDPIDEAASQWYKWNLKIKRIITIQSAKWWNVAACSVDIATSPISSFSHINQWQQNSPVYIDWH